MKVVISRINCREKMFFSTPPDEYEGYDQTIGGEKTSDDPFQVSNNEFHGGHTCGQHVLTKVAKIGKNSYNFEVQKIPLGNRNRESKIENRKSKKFLESLN